MQNEYINREKLKDSICRNAKNFKDINDVEYAGLIAQLEPAADVEEVVRCVSCIHLDKKGICTKFRQRYPFYPEDDFYCAFGERRKKKND